MIGHPFVDYIHSSPILGNGYDVRYHSPIVMERKHYSYSGWAGWADDVRATRDSWVFWEMPEKHIVTTFTRAFNDEELWNLDWGHIARDMDDRWCFYVEDGWASIHRSWSGVCVYKLELGYGPEHTLIINNDPEQVRLDIDWMVRVLNDLLDVWSATVDPKKIKLGPALVANPIDE